MRETPVLAWVNNAATMIRAYRGTLPKVAASAYIDPSAQVIGDVVIGERSSIWPKHRSRRRESIRIGEETKSRTTRVITSRRHFPLIIGNRVTVGHSAMLHGCMIEDECLIGIGAIVLNGAKIGQGSVIAAGALVPKACRFRPAAW